MDLNHAMTAEKNEWLNISKNASILEKTQGKTLLCCLSSLTSLGLSSIPQVPPAAS